MILSNVVLRHRVVLQQLSPQPCAADYLVQLPFATAGLTDQTEYLEALQSQSHIQEYTSVLTAFVIYLHNIIASLGELTSTSGAATPKSGFVFGQKTPKICADRKRRRIHLLFYIRKEFIRK